MTIPLNAPSLTGREEEFVLDALRSGWITLGKYVTRFETEFAAWVGRKRAVACSSGTSALWLALMALRLPAGQRVVTGVYSCDALANAALNATGLPPVVVDVEPETWGADADLMSAALREDREREDPQIGAVVLPHTYGVMARDTAKIEALCRGLGLPLIEDASEAHGAKLPDGRMAGSIGTVSVLSLRGEKVLGAGQFGVCVTDDADLARRIHQYAYNGLPVDRIRFWSTVPGMNCQPSHLNAALACAQLERADELIALRNAVHAGWVERLGQYDGLTFQTPYGIPAWWLTGIRIGRAFTGMLVQDLARGLEERDVGTRPAFYPLNRLPHVGGTESTPVADALLMDLLILPSGPAITGGQQDEIVAAIMQITGRA